MRVIIPRDGTILASAGTRPPLWHSQFVVLGNPPEQNMVKDDAVHLAFDAFHGLIHLIVPKVAVSGLLDYEMSKVFQLPQFPFRKPYAEPISFLFDIPA
jgi:hypothetical protein